MYAYVSDLAPNITNRQFISLKPNLKQGAFLNVFLQIFFIAGKEGEKHLKINVCANFFMVY